MNKSTLALLIVLLSACSSHLFATDFNYKLKPLKIAQDTYVFVGSTEDFSFKNGGNIVNTGFIVTSAGVIVIDTGPSLRYGQQMRAAINTVTNQAINRIYLTHHHPDHFLGNLAFAGMPIHALGATATNIRNEGAGFADNLYLMVGEWMRGTDVLAPTVIATPGVIQIGGHELEVLSYSGHTSSDMAILDRTTGVLFSGDLIFHKRTLTTPHADIDQWIETIDSINALTFNVLVPGHGPLSDDKSVLVQMNDYLTWLDGALKKAANDGLSMTDVMQLKLPVRFESNALLKEEFSKSVVHLFSRYENSVFERLN